MLHRSTIQLLRFHFSLFLLPVYLFAIGQLPVIAVRNAFFVFVILHLLVYPASNGYNSYMDRDEAPIGGLKAPLQPTKQLFYTSVVMDIIAVLWSFFISPLFAAGVFLYIAASRAYSYRGIRLKQFPVMGFLVVFIFQGALIFYITYHACHPAQAVQVPLLPCATASLLIGASYPLTQIYQHEEDKQDGVITISYWLGKRGTFIFSGFFFLAATLSLFFLFQHQMNHFYLFMAIILPVMLFFLYWMKKVWQNEKWADFEHSLKMNVISTICTLMFFLTLIILKHFE